MYDKTFYGGVHPDDGKQFARDVPLRPYLPKGDIILPLSQHIGKPAKPVVKKGERVLAGQLIAQADGFVSANIASSCSGTVKAIEPRRNVLGTTGMAIVIENDGQYTLAEGVGKEANYKKMGKDEILKRIAAAGIVGMGGAGFPTHVKLAPKNPDEIKFVLVNGAECEPYITCDDQTMRTAAGEVITGLQILLSLFPNAEGAVVIEENKPEAIAAMTAACSGKDRVKVHPVQTKYPQGGERSIISVVTGRHLKLGMLPADVGCVVDNVATMRAIYRAVCLSEPLMERGFTVSGDGVKEPCNLTVKLGTLFSEVLEAAGGFADGVQPEKLLCGGPMMGFAMSSLDAAICKNNNALTVLREDPVAIAQEQQTACLRCGRCNQVCPLGLTPQMMAAAVEWGNYERFEKKLYGMDCVACGTCTYVCPAKRPLMQLFKQAKAEVMARKRRG
ncbi:MAG: electron transport complex subunit RsxC [Oscillospiraceae bacterium]|nr:electron transport complex subunit RsxC [Oscillospiraceae bacterium]